MKILKLRFVVLCLGTVLTLGLSHSVARAVGCADIMGGGNIHGNYDCRLFAACGGWCYYNCTCSDLFPGASCDNVLDEAGFEEVEGTPCND
ncbi:MAG TPA: hypothetical protein VMS31_11870 [Pyrinomonadaceae bacterium]|nr:hypothetical protein [Pyrinomonadaceae bacterium]